MPQTSVVVVSYQPGDWLERSLRSVLNQADEVIVVDNGSPGDEATAVATRLGARPVTLGRNTGFPAGVNAGLSVCRGEVVALLNDDAFAEADWLERSVAVLAEPGIAAVTPKLLFVRRYLEIHLDQPPRFAPPDGRPLGQQVFALAVDGADVLADAWGPGIHELEAPPGSDPWRWTAGSGPIYVPLPLGADSAEVAVNGEPVPVGEAVVVVNNAGSYLSAEGYGGDFGYRAPDRGAFDDPADRFAACGAAMVVRRDTLARVGLFAGHFFAYYEDTDWCWRAQLSGLRIRYEPSAVVHHLAGATSGGPHQAWVRGLAARNRLAMLVRNAPPRVVARQLQRARRDPSWPGLRRSLGRALPRAAAERARLARRWSRSPRDVWDQWAGVGETWPGDGRRPAPSGERAG